MRAVIVFVRHCDECPYYVEDCFDHPVYCERVNKNLESQDGTPEWCPFIKVPGNQ